MSCKEVVLEQLRSVSAKWDAARVVIADYQVALRQSFELELRVAQLTKENEELRDECHTKEATIETLADKISHAHADLRAELTAERKLNAELENAKTTLEASFEREKECRVHAESRVEQLEVANAGLEADLTEAQKATALAVSEMQTSKQETDAARKDLRRLESENHCLIEKIKTDQLQLAEKWQEVTETEEMVQSCRAEVERMKAQLIAERELEQEASAIILPWKRRQNPFAKRLSACARLIEKNETEKALQALDVLLIEMRDRQTAGRAAQNQTRRSESGFELVEGEEETPWAETRIHLPTKPDPGHVQHRGGCTSCTSSDTGTLVATGGLDRHVLIWDTATRTVQNTLSGMTEGVRDVSFVCDGSAVLGAGADKTVRVWKLPKGQTHVMTGHSRSVNCVACDPANVNRAVSCGEDRHIRFWDLHRGYQLDGQIGLKEWINTVCYSTGGNFVVSGHSKGSLKLWDARSGNSRPAFEQTLHSDAIVGLCPFPLSTQLLLTAGRDNKLKLVDLRSSEVLHTFTDPRFSTGTIGYMGGARCSLDVSADEHWIAVGSAKGEVMVWKGDGSRANAAEVLKCESHQEAVVGTAWAHERCFSCDRAGNVVIWH